VLESTAETGESLTVRVESFAAQNVSFSAAQA
jgi:hypothetical protein